MRKIILGTIIGGIVYFVAGALVWIVFPWHNTVLKALPNENLVRDSLSATINEPGFYVFPFHRDSEVSSGSKGAGVIVYSPVEPVVRTRPYVVGFIMSLVIAFFCLSVLFVSRQQVRTYALQFGLVVSLGVFGWLAHSVPNWNWFGFPENLTLTYLLDTLVCFGLMGIVLPKFVSESV